MFVLPKGTLVRFGGMPFRLLDDTPTDGLEENYKLALATSSVDPSQAEGSETENPGLTLRIQREANGTYTARLEGFTDSGRWALATIPNRPTALEAGEKALKIFSKTSPELGAATLPSGTQFP